jgi:hypothetical protein
MFRTLILIFLITAPALSLGQSSDADTDADAVQILIDDEEYENAIARVEVALKKHKKNQRLLLQRGFVLVKLERFEAALSHYKKLNRKLKSNPEPGNNLAMVYKLQGKNSEAISQLKKTIKRFPDYAQAYENLGDIYIEIAQAQYKRGADQFPDNEILLSKSEIANDFNQLSTNNTKTAKRNALVEQETVKKQQEQEVVQVVPLATPTDEIMQTLSSWITAWSERNVDDYLLHYSREYVPGDGIILGEWIGRRREDLNAAEFIKINLDQIDITQNDSDLIVANFVQTYESNLLKTKLLKSLTLRLYEGNWLIIKEESRPL